MKKLALIFLSVAALSAFGQSGIYNPFGQREISRWKLLSNMRPVFIVNVNKYADIYLRQVSDSGVVLWSASHYPTDEELGAELVIGCVTNTLYITPFELALNNSLNLQTETNDIYLQRGVGVGWTNTWWLTRYTPTYTQVTATAWVFGNRIGSVLPPTNNWPNIDGQPVRVQYVNPTYDIEAKWYYQPKTSDVNAGGVGVWLFYSGAAPQSIANEYSSAVIRSWKCIPSARYSLFTNNWSEFVFWRGNGIAYEPMTKDSLQIKVSQIQPAFE